MRLLALGLPRASLAAACGGDFSNDDLEFLNALPEREDLAAKLPGAAAQRAARRAAARRRSALGELSKLYADTQQRPRTTSTTGVDGLLDPARAHPRPCRPPRASRTGAPGVPSRTQDHPGMRCASDGARRCAASSTCCSTAPAGTGEDAWWSLLEGPFEAEAGIRKGEGDVHLLVSEARERGLPTGASGCWTRLNIGYQTRSAAHPRAGDPRLRPGASLERGALHLPRLPGRPGEISFTMADIQATPGTALETLDITSRWTADQGGIGTVVIRSGDLAGARKIECWDADVPHHLRARELGSAGRLGRGRAVARTSPRSAPSRAPEPACLPCAPSLTPRGVAL